MHTVRLIHWNAEEAEERASLLRAVGYVVDSDPVSPAALRQLKTNPPTALVIDLSRLPAQGRDVALAVRHAKRTRHIPIVMVDGVEEKLERIKRQLPDAVYTPWSRVRSALERAIASPPADPAVTESALAGYSGTPLPKKLGIKPQSVVALAGAPTSFDATLGDLPEGVTLKRRVSGEYDLIIWFPKNKKNMLGRIAMMAAKVRPPGMWIVWPKQASGMATDLTPAEVRTAGLANGLVDYKICAIDETYSALKFARRKQR